VDSIFPAHSNISELYSIFAFKLCSQIWVTERIKKDLESLAKKEGVTLEGLTCILLRLSLSDRGFVEMVLNLIKSCDLLNNLLIMNYATGECRRL
jgi:hypothetical protein